MSGRRPIDGTVSGVSGEATAGSTSAARTGQTGADRRVLSHPEWRDDPHYATNSARMENRRARS
jgi:hypothetical protein